MSEEKTNFSLCDGNVRAVLEQEAIHLKAVDTYGDPVELSVDEALELASILTHLAENADE